MLKAEFNWQNIPITATITPGLEFGLARLDVTAPSALPIAESGHAYVLTPYQGLIVSDPSAFVRNWLDESFDPQLPLFA